MLRVTKSVVDNLLNFSSSHWWHFYFGKISSDRDVFCNQFRNVTCYAYKNDGRTCQAIGYIFNRVGKHCTMFMFKSVKFIEEDRERVQGYIYSLLLQNLTDLSPVQHIR